MIDYMLQFSDAQALTSQAATASTNVVDTDVADRNAGRAKLAVQCKVNTTFTSNGAATLTVAIAECATVDGSYTVIAQSKAFALADLVKGLDLLPISLPRNHQRYLEMIYTVAAADFTAGAVDAAIVIDPQTE